MVTFTSVDQPGAGQQSRTMTHQELRLEAQRIHDDEELLLAQKNCLLAGLLLFHVGIIDATDTGTSVLVRGPKGDQQ